MSFASKFNCAIGLLLVLIMAIPASAQKKTTIRDIQFVHPDSLKLPGNRDDSPMVGDSLTVVGVVVTGPRSLWTGARWSFILADTAYGEWNFIQVVQHDTVSAGAAATNVSAVQPGDVIRLTGRVAEFPANSSHSQTQIEPFTNPPVPVEFLGIFNFPLPKPIVLKAQDLATPERGEKYEAAYVRIENATMLNNNSGNGNGQALIQDATAQLLIDDWFNPVHFLVDIAAGGNVQNIPLVYPQNGASFKVSGWIRDLSGPQLFALGVESKAAFQLLTSPPTISNISRNIVIPTALQRAAIRAKIVDNGTVASAKIFYSIDNAATWQTVNMAADTGNFYQGEIPSQVNGTFVRHYLHSQDNDGNVTTDPANIQASNYFYTVRDQGPSIYDIQFTPFADGNSGYVGLPVTVSGIVTADSTDFSNEYFIQNGTALWNGLWVRDSINKLKRGDNITITGPVQEQFNQTRINTPTAFRINSRNNPIPAPVVVKTSDIRTGAPTAESYESMLVQVRDVAVINPFPDAPNNFGEFTVSDGSGEVRVDDRSNQYRGNLDTTYAAGNSLQTVTGVLDYLFANFKINPRSNNDVTFVAGNRRPVVANAIPAQIITAGGAAFRRQLMASPAVFSDPDNDVLAYTANSSATQITTATITNDTLTVIPKALGSAAITVTANDGKDGTISTAFAVTVVSGNQPPVVANIIADQKLAVGGISFTRDLNAAPQLFTDPNGDVLSYTANSSAPGIATASISNNTLTVAPGQAGNATITIMANDGKGGTVSTGFAVTVASGNQAPTVAASIPNQTLAVGGAAFTRDLNAAPTIFFDLNGDTLTYTVTSNAPTTAAGNLEKSVLTVVPVNFGSAMITVTANDGKGLTEKTIFNVLVRSGNLPPIVANTISDQTLFAGGNSFTYNLNAPPAIFNDPNGDPLAYTVISSAPTVVAANLATSTLTVVPVAVGNAIITVTANDGKGGTVSTMFTVMVIRGNQPPLVLNIIPEQKLAIDEPPFIRNLSTPAAVFSDPDGDALSYTASSNAPSIAAASISGEVLTVTSVTVGKTRITVTGSDGKGGLVATAFNITINQSCGTTLITHTPPSSQEIGKEIPITANIVNNDCGVTNATLSYRPGGEGGFTSLSMSLTSGLYRSTIPTSAVTSRGIEYYIVATDANGGRTPHPLSGFFSIQMTVSEPGLIKGSPQPAGSEQTAYRLISAPIDLDNKNARAVLEDDLGPYDIFKWRCYEVRADQTRAEYPNISEMRPGKAFWLVVKDQGKVIDTGAGKSNPSSQAYAVALHPKWNLAANPFNFAVPLSNLRLKSGAQLPDVRSYTGSWNNPVTEAIIVMQPFQGYALFNSLATVDTLLINPDLSKPGSALSQKMNEQILWSIRILAQCQQARDGDNTAAIASEAVETWDEMDRPEPPVIGEYVSVYFPHPEWKKPNAAYCTDVRPESSDGEVWTFEVRTNIRDVVQLNFEGLESVPSHFQVWLVDEALKITHNLREKSGYFVAGSNAELPKRLQLMVGTGDFASKRLATVQTVPDNYELSPNFPNPFHPITTIRYGLPKAERVTLKVYNLFGQEVTTLIKNELKAAGYHIAVWNGRNQAGIPVAGGMYIYRIQAGNSIAAQKMILLR